MQKDDYIIIEQKTLNSNAEEVMHGLGVGSAKGWAQRVANRNDKVYVVVRVVSIIVPEDAAQQTRALDAGQACPSCSGVGHYLVGDVDEQCSYCDGSGKA